MSLLDFQLLQNNRRSIEMGDERLRPAVEQLRADAAAALEKRPWSVMDKGFSPPGGDKHDYMSVGPYWWPNPDTPDGLPFVWRDGEINPHYYQSDGGTMREMSLAVETLSLAYFLLGEERYASHATRILRTWFLDETTKMNPHLRYAQAIPGVTEGRSIGVVDSTQNFSKLPDAIVMLRGSKSWGDADEEGMKAWFGRYLHWILTDDFGMEEAKQSQNHGTWCDAMISSLSLYTGRPEIARRTLAAVPTKIIADQIEPDGAQPHELWRTRAFTYSTVNLLGIFHLATMAQPLGICLWHFETEDGRCIRKAVDWLAPYVDPALEWPYKEIGENVFRPVLRCLLRRAAAVYAEPRFRELVEERPEAEWQSDRCQLLWGALDD